MHADRRLVAEYRLRPSGVAAPEDNLLLVGLLRIGDLCRRARDAAVSATYPGLDPRLLTMEYPQSFCLLQERMREGVNVKSTINVSSNSFIFRSLSFLCAMDLSYMVKFRLFVADDIACDAPTSLTLLFAIACVVTLFSLW